MLKYVLIILLILMPILSAETYISVNPIEVSVAPQEQIPYIVGLVKDGEVQQVLPWDFKFSAEKGSFSGNVYKAPPVPGTYLVFIRYKTIESVAVVNVIGREPVKEIIVEPSAVNLALGESISLKATVLGKSKNVLFYQVGWMANGGKIDSNGKFTAEKIGRYEITALGPDGLKTKVAVNVQEQRSTLNKIVISTPKNKIFVGETLQLTAVGYDQRGQAVDTDFIWRGASGKENAQGYEFIASKIGIYNVSVKAADSDVEKSVSIEVVAVPAKLQKIELTVNDEPIYPGMTVKISSQGYDQYGKTINFQALWRVDKGTIDTQGNFTANEPGVYKVEVKDAGSSIVQGRQIVVVENPNIAANENRESLDEQIIAGVDSGEGEFANEVDPEEFANEVGPEEFASEGDAEEFANEVDPEEFAENNAGNPEEFAENNAGNPEEFAENNAGNPEEFAENNAGNPEEFAENNAGNPEEFAENNAGNPEEFAENNAGNPEEFAENNAGNPEEFAENNAGNPEEFAENNAGNPEEFAENNVGSTDDKAAETSSREQQDELDNNVAEQAGENAIVDVPVGLKIATENISLQPGEQYQFSVEGSSEVRWEATGGTIDSSGLFTAGSATGDFVVVATDGDQYAKARVYVFHGLQEVTEVSNLEVLPKSITLQPGESAQFSANAYDANNNKIAVDIEWIATGGTIDRTGLYTAHNAMGNYSVKAVYKKQSLEVSSRVVIAANNEYTLHVSPVEPRVKPGEKVNFQVTLRKSNKEIWSWPWEYTFVASEGEMNDTVYTAPQKPGAYNIEIRHPKAVTNVIVIVATGKQNSRIKEIQVNRESLTLQAYSKYTFVANAIAEDGSVQQISLLWRTNGGRVDASGTFTAGGQPGNYTIEVSEPISGVTKTIELTIIEKKADAYRIESDPKEIILPIGTTQKINFKLFRGSFEEFSWPWEYKSSVSGGTFENSIYTAPKEVGEHVLEVEHKKAKAKFKITVTEPQIASFTIKSDTNSVKEGAKVKFVAEVTDGQGSRTYPLEWSCSGGKIKQNGWYLASESGVQTITAKIVGTDISAEATLTVIGRMKMFIEPRKLTVPVGEKLRLKITMYKGKEKLWAWPWEFKCIAEKGSFHETLYTAPDEPGTYRVKIRYKKWVKRTKIVVYTPNYNKSRIVITPQSVTLEPLKKHRFTAEVYDAQNNKLSANIQWRAQGGVMEGDGTYTAGAISGDYTVVAVDRERTLETQAKVSIVEPIERIVIVPGNKEMRPGETFKFSALGVRRSEEETPVDVQWNATGGKITSQGVFTAGQKEGGYFTVTANTKNGLSSTAKVRIASSNSVRLKIIPESATVAPGESIKFEAVGVDSNENKVSVTPKWFAIGGTISKDGVYYAGDKAGRYYVTVIDTESHLFAKASILIEDKQQNDSGYSLRISTSSTTVRPGENVVIKPALLKNGKVEWTWPWEFKYKSSGGVLVGEYGNIWIAPKRPGSYTVTIAHRKAIQEIALEVQGNNYEERIEYIDISPKKITLQPNELYKFSAAAYLQNGTKYPVRISWSATGGRVDQSGTYQAGSTPGNYVIIARYRNIEAVTDVIIGRQDTTFSLGLDWGRSLRSGSVSRRQTGKFIYGNIFTKDSNELEQFRRGFIKGYGAAGLYLFQELLCHTANDFGKIYGHNLYWGNVTKNQLANFIRQFVLRLPDSCHHSFKQGFVSGYKHYKGGNIYEQIYRWAKYRR